MRSPIRAPRSARDVRGDRADAGAIASIATRSRVFSKLLADVQRDGRSSSRITGRRDSRRHRGQGALCGLGRGARRVARSARRAHVRDVGAHRAGRARRRARSGNSSCRVAIKRVAQQVVARADEDARLLVALAATGGVSLDAATIAVGSAILAVAMTRQLTTDRARARERGDDRAALRRGRVVLGGVCAGPQRTLNDDELDRVPTRTVLALTALGRMHAPARARTALLYEVWSMRRAHRLGVSLQGSPAAHAARSDHRRGAGVRGAARGGRRRRSQHRRCAADARESRRRRHRARAREAAHRRARHLSRRHDGHAQHRRARRRDGNAEHAARLRAAAA